MAQQEQFLQAALNGDVAMIKTYLDTACQAPQSCRWPLEIRLRAFINTPSVEIADMLLKTGITDVNACIVTDKLEEKYRLCETTNALIVAVLKNNVNKVQWLLGQSANFNKPYLYEVWDAKGHRKGSRSVFGLACEGDCIEIAGLLCAAGVNIDTKDSDGQTALFGAIRCERIKIVKFLLDNGADVNVKDVEGKTPLYWALKGGNIEITQLLVAAGADVNMKVNDYSPLYWALEYWKHYDIATFLKSAGAKGE